MKMVARSGRGIFEQCAAGWDVERARDIFFSFQAPFSRVDPDMRQVNRAPATHKDIRHFVGLLDHAP